MELEKVKKRRIEREHERDEREKEREMLQRDKEADYHCQWEKQEDNVSAGMLEQCCWMFGHRVYCFLLYF